MDEVKIWALDGDSNVVPLASKGQTDTDKSVTMNAAYTYQVAAVSDGGEATRSALLPVQVPCVFTVTPCIGTCCGRPARARLGWRRGRTARGLRRASLPS